MVISKLSDLSAMKCNNTQPYCVSRYLQIIKITDDDRFCCYHSLFGNIFVLHETFLKFLKAFDQPNSFGSAINDFENSEEFGNLFSFFRDLFFIVPEGFDERILVNQELKSRVQSIHQGQLLSAVQLCVSERCNLGCKYCYADRVDERSNENNFDSRNIMPLMDIEMAQKTIDACAAVIKYNKRESLVVKFSGREPLLNLEVIKQTIDYCGEIYPDLFFQYVITTNGTMISQEIIKIFKLNGFVVIVSLDGLPSGNSMRVTKSGKNSFPMVDEGLKELQNANIKCSVASVLTDANFNADWEGFAEYLNSRSINDWEIKLGMQTGGDFRYSADEYVQKLLEIYNYANVRGLNITGDWIDPFITFKRTKRRLSDEFVSRPIQHGCSATNHQITVEPSGNIHPCRAMEMSLGSIDNLSEVFESVQYKNLVMRTYSNVEACKECPIEGFCQGVCLGHSEAVFGDIYSIDNRYCEIYRRVFNLLLKETSEHKTFL